MIAGNDQDLAAGQQVRRVQDARRVQASGHGEFSGGRIVELGAAEVAAVCAIVLTGCEQDIAIRQQSCRLAGARSVQASRQREGSACWVVEFGAGEVVSHGGKGNGAGVENTAGNQDLAIAKQGSRRAGTRDVQIARGGKCSGGRVVDFGGGHGIAAIESSGEQDVAVREQGRAVSAGTRQASGRAEGSTGGIVEFRAGERAAGGVGATGDQYFSVVEQRGRVRVTPGVEAAGGAEGAGRGIV